MRTGSKLVGDSEPLTWWNRAKGRCEPPLWGPGMNTHRLTLFSALLLHPSIY